MENETSKQGMAGGNKMNFWLGFFSGLAIISVLGFFILLGVMFSGKQGVSLQAQDDDSAPTVVADDTVPTPAPTVDVRPLDKDDHIRGGDVNSPVQLIVYDDFECPFCLRHTDTLKQIEEEYGDKVAIGVRHFPLSFHPNAQKAAEASECASEQGKFWEMYDELFAAQEAGTLGISTYKSIAKDLGLKTSQFDDCLDSGKYAQMIKDEEVEGQSFGVSGTPGNILNGQLISGAVPFATFKAAIDSQL